MTPISARVLAVDKLYNEYLVTVRLGDEKYSGSFAKLGFHSRPDFGWYEHGWLELVYRRNPGLLSGQSFPLWSNK